jgi:NAD(P)-dependent dehydrogenase (short-subunit alcohol dehydrogenase family)
MRFTALQMESFASLSHDVNPLHCDPVYAARTPFGRVVVYGVCGVLRALGEWAAGRRFTLQTMKVTFRRPMFLEEDYELAVTEASSKVTLRWLREGEPVADIRFRWAAGDDHAGSTPATAFAPLPEASDPLPDDVSALPDALPYAIGAAGLAAMADAFRLAPDQLPRAQLEALCGASYLVGMMLPGRQALFSELAMTFADGSGATFHGLRAGFDPRFSRFEITGAGSALASLEVGAFRRPDVGGGLDGLARIVGRSSALAGKTAVVTGSGRGLGAVLVQALALHGANVVVHYHRSEAQARAVADELRAIGDPLLLGANLADEAETRRFADAVLKRFGRVDLLVHSAVPAIRRADYLGQSTSDVVGYVSQALALAAEPTRALADTLRATAGSTVVSISSVYARDPPAGFAHYAAAKGALESFTIALAKELTEVAFLILRPPRLTPDVGEGGATPSVAAWAATSPADVARVLVQRLSGARAGRCETIEME